MYKEELITTDCDVSLAQVFPVKNNEHANRVCVYKGTNSVFTSAYVIG